MQHHLSDVRDVLDDLKTKPEGLEPDEALKRSQGEKNKLKEGERTPFMMRLMGQLSDPMILVLIGASIVSGITSYYSQEGFTDSIIIMLVVIVNAFLGLFQESKAEKAIESLKNMTAATSKVIRGGSPLTVKSEEIVRGDIVVLEAGDAVPADGRIIECFSMKVEEAALTGESVPVSKSDERISGSDSIPLGDRKNMVYMGSSVVYGRGKIAVTDIGMSTEMGKIADAISQAKDEKTPLQKRLSWLSKILTYCVIAICAFMFVFKLLTVESIESGVVIDTFMIAVSLAVAAIPEGLATVVTIVLSIGVTNMSKKRAIIRKLTAVETLGCAQIICSDKTGTLTQNKMTVTESFSPDEKLLGAALALCSDAEFDGSGTVIGEPTECALVSFANTLSLFKPDLESKSPRVGEAPFDSSRKMMTTIHKTGSTSYIGYTKGAPDRIVEKCSSYFDGSKVQKMSDEKRKEIISKNKEMADKALRVLAAAFKNYDAMPGDLSPEALENDLVFIGLAGMIDPVRPEVKDAIEQCKSAGIRPIMITGDHKDTAVAIAKELQIIESDNAAITGAELDKMSDDEYEKNIEKYSVYARVQPENKSRIVNMWKKKGYVCAMTGDGVNDAPSIKNADIGIGMGITGTDVTKNVADMVLTDDNFATIVGAVAEGRKIYDNMKKSIQFLLSSNLSEVVCIFFATMLGFTILKPVHLLYINLITDTFPALALGMEGEDEDIMSRNPRRTDEKLLNRNLGLKIVFEGVMISILTIAAYFIGHYIESGKWEIISESSDGITMAFLTLSMAEIFHSFNMRSLHQSIFKINSHNKYLWFSSIASFLLTTAVLYVPFLRNAFNFEYISLFEYSISMLLGLSVIPIIEIFKIFFKFEREE